MNFQMIEKIKSDHAFFFYRGRVALYALLQAMDIGPGDEVLLQAFTCLAVPNPIKSIGATPIYVDINPQTLNIDAAQIEAKITDRTRAIVVQHTFGIPAEMDAILAVANKHNLYVIEDCCHALGSSYKGQELGTFGDAAFYSFEWGKPIVVGLGGSAVVHTEKLRDKLRAKYETFKSPSAKEAMLINFQYAAHTLLRRPTLFWRIRDIYHLLSEKRLVVGNFRPEEFKGQISSDYQKKMIQPFKTRLSRKLVSAHKTISQRNWITAQYKNGLQSLGLNGVVPSKDSDVAYLRYPLLTRKKLTLLQEAKKNNIEMGDWFATPIHPLTEAQWSSVDYQKGSCPAAEELCGRIITLPIYSGIQQPAIDRTVKFLQQMQSRCLI